MKLKNLISIDYKGSSNWEKLLYAASLIIPVLSLIMFLFLYFSPFGLNINVSSSLNDLIEEKGNIFLTDQSNPYTNNSLIKNSKYIDGVLPIKYSPALNLLKVDTTISVEGDNIYLIKQHINNNDLLNNWDYILSLDPVFNNARFESIDDYTIRDSNLISFSLNLRPNWEYSSYPQLILKYQNLRIILNETNIEVCVDELVDNNLITYHANYYFYEQDKKRNLDLIVTYKKPVNDSNGFVEIYVNNNLGQRVSIPTEEKLLEKNLYTKENSIVWSTDLLLDLSQKFVSLGQEEFTENLLKTYPQELKETIDLYKYYYNLRGEMLEDQTINSTSQIWSNFFEKDPNDYSTLIQTFYPKTFYNYYNGKIYSLKIKYTYPIKLTTTETLCSIDTPFLFYIYGDNGVLKSINIAISKNPIWER